MRILLVEDNAVQGDTLSMVLSMKGHQCDWAANGEAALAFMSRHSYDLLIVDNYMPGIDGMTFISRIRQQQAWRNVPAVLLTAVGGDALEGVLERLAELQPAALVRKPCRVEEIESALAGLMATTGK